MTERLPLSGVTVLDFTQVMAGPYCTRLLVESGAEVLKVEPVDGEVVRQRPPLVEGRSRYFGQLNAGKQSLAIDMRRPEAQETIRSMLPWIDVVVENFRPGVMERFGLDAVRCRGLKESLVYCSISGYGQHGPEASLPAVAPIIHAVTGLDMSLMDQLGLDQPPNSGIFTADVLSGAIAFGAISAALRSAAVTGVGATLDLSLTDSVMSLLVHEVQSAQSVDSVPSPAYEAAATLDGHVMIALLTDRHVVALAAVLDDPGIVTDDRFATMQARRFNTGALRERIETWSTARTSADVEKSLGAAGVPCGRYRTVSERVHDPVLHRRGSVYRATDGSGDFWSVSASPRRSDQAGAPLELDNEAGVVHDLGADGTSILRRYTDLDDASIANLLMSRPTLEHADQLARTGLAEGLSSSTASATTTTQAGNASSGDVPAKKERWTA